MASYPRLFRSTVMAAAALLLLAIDCSAQSQPQDHSCTVDFAFEYTNALGKDGNNFSSGRGFQAGGGFEVIRPTEPGHGLSLYITANFMYDRLPATASALAQAIQANSALAGATSARGSFDAATLDPTFRYSLNPRTSLYLAGGFGWFRRGVEFKGANPATLTVSNSYTLDRLSTNSGVFDLGGGVNVGLTRKGGPMLYAEARVYRGLAVNSGTTLAPLPVGVRW